MPEASLSQSDNGPAPDFDLQDIFDNAPIGIFTFTPEGRFLSANPAMARMLGYESPEELIESVKDIASQLYADQEARAELVRLLQDNGEVIDYEALLRRKDGSCSGRP